MTIISDSNMKNINDDHFALCIFSPLTIFQYSIQFRIVKKKYVICCKLLLRAAKNLTIE